MKANQMPLISLQDHLRNTQVEVNGPAPTQTVKYHHRRGRSKRRERIQLMHQEEEGKLLNNDYYHGSSSNGFSHTFQTPLKNYNRPQEIDHTEKQVMHETREFEHNSSSGENGRVNFNEVLQRSHLFDSRNHAKFVQTSLQSRMNFSQRNINEIETPSLGLKFIQRFIKPAKGNQKQQTRNSKTTGRLTVKTQPSIKLLYQPALSSRPTAVDDQGDPFDEEVIDSIICGIKD